MADYIKPVVFKIGGESYGVDINLVQSIEKQVNVVPVPNSCSYIKGIVNLRGEVIPVYSLKRKFNSPDDNTCESSVIINTGEVRLALEVDEVLQISEISPENIVCMPEIVKSQATRYMDRVANVEGNLIVLLDVKELLTEEEENAVKELTEDMQK